MKASIDFFIEFLAISRFHGNYEVVSTPTNRSTIFSVQPTMRTFKRFYNAYEILGLRKPCTKKQIHKAYLRKAFEFHPDRNPNATKEFIQVQQAYDQLCNPIHKTRNENAPPRSPEQRARMDWHARAEMYRQTRKGENEKIYGPHSVLAALVLGCACLFGLLFDHRVNQRIQYIKNSTRD